MNSPVRIGATMYVLASILVLALLTLLFSDAMDRQRNPNSAATSVTANDGTKSIILKRNRAGHYVVDGSVNGRPAEFLLDTGATAVSVSESFAHRAGLRKGARMQAVTASGMTNAYATNIDSLIIGGIEERNVVASIVPRLPDGQILLGMSFLKRLDFSQRGDTLILTQHNFAVSSPNNQMPGK
jgi:aspartyl protease family protein